MFAVLATLVEKTAFFKKVNYMSEKILNTLTAFLVLFFVLYVGHAVLEFNGYLVLRH